ncbi:CHC2 zinc finger domain-containing protein [Priestia aryabhattai]|uniref:CHC2 zinc finger domain-containing protein n=1 Tax=Priestia aryabhattai TaxID=412384 RepID=UPI001C8ED592|nr:CHC2 zinc finger domain-containing protein [Priestia aryabhattai]MBY0062355.1 hypothetical protein [Priestia aryabhattai]
MTISRIKASLSIKTAVERYTNIDLKRYRNRQKQLNVNCPFHKDRNPSLTLYFHTDSWYCHAGCGGGDQIELVKRSFNLSLKQTIRMLMKDLCLEKGECNYRVRETKQLTYSRAHNHMLTSNFDKEVGEALLNLNDIKNKIISWSKQITSLNEIDEGLIYYLYHLKPKIEKWSEELSSDDYEIQYFSLLEVKINFKEALDTWLKTTK